MQPVLRSEVLPIGEYETVRAMFRARVIQEKKARRVPLGERMSCVFENHDTVLLQIQEMLRTERITKESSIAHEIATYNELVPGPRELSCTAMIEIVDDRARDAFLVAAKGVEQCFSVEVAGESFAGRVGADRLLEDRASAVIYLKFALSEAATSAIRAGAPATLRVDHEAYRAAMPLPSHVAAALAEDLAS